MVDGVCKLIYVELEYQLRDSGATILISAPDKTDVAQTAASRAQLRRNQVFLFDSPFGANSVRNQNGVDSWSVLWSSDEDARTWRWKAITTIDEAQTTTAVINYSSGTTGVPKGVELSHYNLVANSMQLVHKRSLVADNEVGRKRRARLDASGERWLAPLPMYHAYASY